MPPIKEVSKCRRIPREKQDVGSGESVDDVNTELDDEFVKLRKLFSQKRHDQFTRILKKKIKNKLLNRQMSDSSDHSIESEPTKVEYPDPLPKVDKNKNARGPVKKSGLGEKNKRLSKPLKKKENLGKTTTDGSNSNPGASKIRNSTKLSKDGKKDEKPIKNGPDKKKNENPKKGPKGMDRKPPVTKNDRDLTKNEVEAMIRLVLKQSREEGGNTEEIDDVSLGETESTPSQDELDIGKDPEMSSTPDDVSGEISYDEEEALVY